MNDPLDLFGNQEGSDPLGLFSDTNSIPGAEEYDAAQAAGKLPGKSKFSMKGLGEAALNVGTGLLAFPAGLAVGAGNLLVGNTKEADKAAGKVMEEFTYQPRDPFGQDVAHGIGQLINDVGIPMMGIHMPPVMSRPKGPTPGLTERLKGLEEKPIKPMEDPLGLFAPDNEILPSNAPQYGIDHSTGPGMWTMDKEGHPYRADLSMDAQLMQNPLQRDLWGEDMVNAAGADRTLHQAMDDMAAKGGEIPEAVNKLKEEIKADREMQQAHYDAGDVAREGPLSIPRSQAGRIDMAALEDAFYKFKYLPDGILLGIRGKEGVGAHVEAITPEGKKVGEVRLEPDKFNFTPEDNLRSGWTKIEPSYRGKGLAEQMYQFGAEHAGDIVPSKSQTAAGRKMWDRFEQQGTSQGMKIPSKQRGAIDLGEQKKKTVQDITGVKLFADNPKPEATVAEALAEGKDSKAINNAEAGSTLAALKRDSAVVRDVGRLGQAASKKAELNFRENGFPIEQAVKKLSKQELIDLAAVMKKESSMKTRMTLDQLESLGLSDKQMEAYANLRAAFDDVYNKINDVRAQAGLKPITKEEAYLSSIWKGDYRRPIMDKDGKVVWWLAADSRGGLGKQTKALLKEFPDLVVGKDQVMHAQKHPFEAQALLTTAIDILGRDDPAVQKLQEWAESKVASEAYGAMGEPKHFKVKAGVRGFVGDRPGVSAFRDAVDMMQQQVNFIKTSYKWTELQKVAPDVKEILSNPDLMTQQPNNMKYAQDYWRNQIGMGESQLARAFEDTLRDGGVSPSVVRSWVGGLKTTWIMQKLLGLGFYAANLVQTTAVLPHMVDLMAQGHGKNPVTALISGIFGGSLMATGHYMNMTGGNLYKMMDRIPNGDFMKRAFKYAEDNGVTARSVYDESPIQDSFSPLAQTGRVAGKVLNIPETYVRSFAYMTFVQQLKEGGKFKNDLDLFRAAEERVNVSMADYRAEERALVFNKAGLVGNAFNVLQTYPINFYQQWNYFARQAAQGNVLPFAALMATTYGVGGLMGLPGFNDVTKLWDWVKKNLPTTMWNEVKDIDPKLWILDHGWGETALYGALSTQSGISMTGRVSAPSGSEMIQAPGGMLVDLGKQAMNWGNLVMNPTDKTAQTQAVMGSLPAGLQGLAETTVMKDRTYAKRPDGTYGPVQKSSDLESRQGMYNRSVADEKTRAFGFRSQNEAFEKDLAYQTSVNENQLNKRSTDLLTDIYDAARNGDKEKAQKLGKLYVELTGQDLPDGFIDARAEKEFTTSLQRAETGAKQVKALVGAARAKKIYDEHIKRQAEENLQRSP